MSVVNKDLENLEPFEICSIRPPTENYSLTFRLTRNCGWNRCMFCPIYKLGARFSKRGIEEIKRDVDNAKQIDDLLLSSGFIGSRSSSTPYSNVDELITAIKYANPGLGTTQSSPPGGTGEAEGDELRYGDERLAWFSTWFKEKPTIEDSVYHVLTWRNHGGQSCFLGDANSLLLSADFFTEAVDYIRNSFPTLTRFTIYGRTKSAARKSLGELKALCGTGLNRIHFGIESGSDRVLAFMKKGETAEHHVEGCRKTREAGMSPSVYIMPGLGGAKWSREHALETARVLAEARPDYVRIRTLEVFPGTGLAAAVREGTFMEASEAQVAREIRTIVEQTDADMEIVSDSASNLLDVSGRLPHDRSRMLRVIDDYLGLSEREKLIFSLSSRLQSFIGQYGGVSEDIVEAVRPYLKDGAIDPSKASTEELQWIIRLIRSKLMP